jgi:hypothetical protein
MTVNASGTLVTEPEPSIWVEEKLIQTIELKNGQTLELYDASRKVAGDRWRVSLIARILISTDSSVLQKTGLSANEVEEIRNAFGEKVVFEKKRERNFIDQKKKGEVFEDLMHTFINTSVAYLSNEKFPQNFVIKVYKKHKERKSWYNL